MLAALMKLQQQQHGSAAALLLWIAALLTSTARASDCWAFETDLKYHIPLGVHGTNGGCFKGVRVDENNCDVRTGGLTRTERIFSSLAACCEALEPQLKRDPRNGQPRTDQANAKSVCLSYKKAPAASQQQPAAAAAGGRKLMDSSVCYAIETDYKYNIPMGVYGTFGGCVKGTTQIAEASRTYCNTDVRLDATRSEGSYGSLEACCNALEPRLQIDPRNGQPRKDQVNGKAVCLSYKKTPPVMYGQPAPARKYLMFKAQDLPAEFDIPSSRSSHTKVCGGLDAVAKACSKEGASCGAFTYGGDKDCGYLKYRYYGDTYPGPPPLKFTGNNKGWSTYVQEGIVSKAQGGSLDCADAKNAGVTLCQIKAILPPVLSSLNA